ncbi:hypothetical protein [Cryptosporangium arvum]|uniref:hypothetical protein n=1 Tax=Cryptosporangium arvum TaxID=80871 RepID=UPI0004B4D3E6|nr:hypothetical protein [Cryptosporangium arvum]
MGWLETGDTDDLARKGGRFDGAVVDNGATALRLVEQLRELDAQRIAGGEVLDALRDGYFKPTKAGAAFNVAVNDQVESLTRDGEDMGTNVISAAVDYKLQDTDAAADIRQAGANIHT